MISVGKYNRLLVVRTSEFGLELGLEADAPRDETVLLPHRLAPKSRSFDVGEELNVFVFYDSEDRLTATTQTPKVQVDQFAKLRVVDINRVGLFLDWGLDKDLLLPHSEEFKPLQVGDEVFVYVFRDDRIGRITASAKIERYLDKAPVKYSTGDEVDLLPVSGTDLGIKAIVNHTHWGLLHKSELSRFLNMGEAIKGYIREVRPDGKISLSLKPVGQQAVGDLADIILEKLKAEGGKLMLSDKSAPEVIKRVFGTSKGNFKKAIGGLYKRGLISIEADSIQLVD